MNLNDTYKLRTEKLKEINIDSYSDYLKSNEWLRLKEKIKRRAGAKWNFCNICGSSSNLNIHHSSYKVIGQEHPGNTVKMLCQSCHYELHNLSKKNPEWSFYKACGKLKSQRVKSRLPIFKHPTI